MKFLKFLLKWSLILFIWISIFGSLALIYYLRDLPSLSDLEAQNGKEIVQINYVDGERITNRGEIYSSEISYFELPQNLVNAVIAIEDRRFFSHFGIDVFGILRAFLVNREAGKIVQGGSTITQQLAKLLFLNPERMMKRKVQEILLAVQLERNFTKEQILTFYLNRAYFGAGNYGVNNATRHYFGKDVSNLNLNESAILAGLLKAPSKFSPKNNRELASKRANVVISAMIDAGFLDQNSLKEIDVDADYKIDHAQKLYFADFVYKQFGEIFEKKEQKNNLFSITTTLDETLQNKVEDAIDEFSDENEKKISSAEIAVIVMAKDGAILAMSGGKDYQKSQFNRATEAKRQAGSAFKTFVYLAAFEKGFKPSDLIEDKKINIGTWLPENYNNRYAGEVTLRNAFANSLNSVAVQVAKKVGGREIVKTAKNCGIVSKIDANDPTISLGTTEVSLLELTSSYATIANNGSPVSPYAINEIKNNDGEVLYQRHSSGLESVFLPESLLSIKQLLREVVENGTGKNANISSSIYGKTGTSQNFRDAWFIGFDDDFVVGVWIGNDDNKPTAEITGGSLPAQLFAEILQKI